MKSKKNNKDFKWYNVFKIATTIFSIYKIIKEIVSSFRGH